MAEINGTEGPDTLTGTAGDDTINGFGANDTLRGLAGDDTLDGGSGQDRLEGGSGNDDLRGLSGLDSLLGGDGDDLLRGDSGDDRLRGEGGNDRLQGGLGNDDLQGGPGRDVLDGGPERDVLDGGPGRDTMFGNSGDDFFVYDVEVDEPDGLVERIDGGPDDDTLQIKLDFATANSSGLQDDLSRFLREGADTGPGGARGKLFTFESLDLEVINVESVILDVANVPPDARNDSATVSEDGPARTIDVLANDRDDGALTVTGLNTSGVRGQVSIQGNKIVYDPNGRFESLGEGDTATETFSYAARDDSGLSDRANVTVTVEGRNDAPDAQPDFGFRTDEDTALRIKVADLLANDSDPDAGDSLRVIRVGNPDNGEVRLEGDEVVFTPDGPGNASFRYTLADETSGRDATRVSVRVDDAEAPPPPPPPPPSGDTRLVFQQTQTEAGQNFRFVFDDVPEPRGDGRLIVTADGDYSTDSADESLSITFDGFDLGEAAPGLGAQVLSSNGPNDVRWRQSFDLDEDVLDQAAADGFLTIVADLSPSVDFNIDARDFVRVEIIYDV